MTIGFNWCVRVLFGLSVLALVTACQSGAGESGVVTAEPSTTALQTTSVARVGSVEERLAFVGGLFRGGEQYESFARLGQIFPARTIAAGSKVYRFSRGEALSIPESYEFEGVRKPAVAFLDDTRTSALLVLHNGEIRYENYWLTGGKEVPWISFSVAKSFVSALIGIAIDDGLIESVETPITRYVPELAGSAYDGVRIKDVLQMSSGARWVEDYSDPNSDIMRYGQVWAGAGSGSFDAFRPALSASASQEPITTTTQPTLRHWACWSVGQRACPCRRMPSKSSGNPWVWRAMVTGLPIEPESRWPLVVCW